MKSRSVRKRVGLFTEKRELGSVIAVMFHLDKLEIDSCRHLLLPILRAFALELLDFRMRSAHFSSPLPQLELQPCIMYSHQPQPRNPSRRHPYVEPPAPAPQSFQLLTLCIAAGRSPRIHSVVAPYDIMYSRQLQPQSPSSAYCMAASSSPRTPPGVTPTYGHHFQI